MPLPEPEAPTPQVDVASWPVAQAWANRIDQVGSQAVILARERPGRDLADMSVVISDDRGIVDGMGEAGVRRRLAERMALPPGAPIYRVVPEYVRWRIRQGEETSRQVGRRVAPEYLTWRHLLDGIADDWRPDLEALCEEKAQPGPPAHGLPAGENAQPMLSRLLITAAWGLDPASGIPPRKHPFVRQMPRKAVEVLLMS